jgi:hypothetical protein
MIPARPNKEANVKSRATETIIDFRVLNAEEIFAVAGGEGGNGSGGGTGGGGGNGTGGGDGLGWLRHLIGVIFH